MKVLPVLIFRRIIDHPFHQSANFRSWQAIHIGLEIAVEGNIEAASQDGLRQDRRCCGDRAEVLGQ
ncbi:hypothetical protein P3W85_45150 [Cupriavidus basilensis]|uniref:Uncharacterized protein n=1 Tax=Cupriavidus basilensis TaxID=68895 RepID=A0ABT6B5F2_9BURK|nr:hypothetical protein [Cupriavidus basilensis]MDF3840063.1 hypothetical protein [Cupriavidus basilensis]